MTCLVLADYLNDKKRSFSLVDGDESNPDFYKAFSNTEKPPTAFSTSLNTAEQWIDLINFIQKNPGDMIINSAAGSLPGITKFGNMLESALGELNQPLVTLWPINRQRDSLESLIQFTKAMSSPVHVVKNLFFGDATKFQLFDDSKIKAELTEKGWPSITLPDLADRVSDELYTKRLTIASAILSMPLGNRIELQRWRNAAHAELAEIIN